MQLIAFFLPAAMMWTVGMAKPDTAARGPSQQTWDAGLFARLSHAEHCPTEIMNMFETECKYKPPNPDG